jgi:ankyrin repeat protein
MEVLLRSTADHVTFDNLKLRPQRGPINMTRVRQGALILAISIGDINTVATMLNEGADPNAGTVHLPCPLVTACRVGIMDITKLLIKTGAEINGGTIGSSLKGFRRSPLQSACEEGRTDIVHLLMNQAYDLTEDYAFKFAVASCINAGQTELFHFLSSKMGGSTSETLLYLGAVNGNVEIVNMLLERMHVGPHRLFETRLCLDLAAKNGRVTLVKALLDRGVQRYKTLSLTLLLAVLERRLEVARVLVDDGGALINSRHHFRGPEPNFGHVFTGTALMAAARNGDCPMIQMLMDRGVDLKMHRQGARALVLAKRRGHIDAVRFLTESN